MSKYLIKKQRQKPYKSLFNKRLKIKHKEYMEEVNNMNGKHVSDTLGYLGLIPTDLCELCDISKSSMSKLINNNKMSFELKQIVFHYLHKLEKIKKRNSSKTKII